ncbi:MAG: hypothetical protein IKF19_02740 [Bacilli bacterium]|nr:hypothetical protein [Bacilli bacterium]
MMKRILIIIGILVLIICGGVGYYFYLMNTQEDMLKQEIINYSNKDLLKDDYIVNVKTKGDYAYIEEKIKKYYKELSNNIKTINNYLIDLELEKLMTPDNLETDRPNFINSYKTIDDTEKSINDSMDKVKELCSKEYIKNLITDKIHDKYYLDLYNSLMYTKKDIEELNDIKIDTEELSNNLNLFLHKVKDILNILEKNNQYWSIEKNSVYITNEKVLNEYNEKYKELKDIIDNKLSKYKNRPISKGNSNNVITA